MSRHTQETASVWLAITFLLLLTPGLRAQSPLSGTWKLDRQRSSDVDPWRAVTLEIRERGNTITFIKTWKAGRYSQRDSMTVVTGGAENRLPIRPGKWMEQVHLAVYVPREAVREVVANWGNTGRVLRLQSRYTLETSQGETPITIEREFRISGDGQTLTVTEKRSSRKTGPPLVFVYTRAGARKGGGD